MKNVNAIYVTDIKVPGESADEKATILYVWKNPETGKLVAIDNMELDSNYNFIFDPYDPETRLVFHDTFTGLPK